MYCRHCGKETDENSEFCTHCGKPTNKSTSEVKIEGFGKNLTVKEPYQRWSWGAFGLGWIYLACMGYRYYGWLLILNLILSGLLRSKDLGINVIGLITWLIIIIFLGIKGRSIAWESRVWKNKEEFINTQKRWDIWGVIIFVVIQTLSFYIYE